MFSGTRHAKKSYIILTCTQTLCKLCGTLLIVGFVTNIFKETGSILSEKDSSTLIIVIQFISNVVFSLLVEQINRRVRIHDIAMTFFTKNKLSSRFQFADTLCLVVTFDNGQLCIIYCVWIFLEQASWLRVDANCFCCCSGFLQFHRFFAVVVYHDTRAITTKSIQKSPFLNTNLT